MGMMSFKLLIASMILWFGNYLWVAQIFGVLLLFFVAHKVFEFYLKRIQDYCRVTHHWTVELSIKAARKPLQFAFLAMCLLCVLGIFNENTMLVSSFKNFHPGSLVVAICLTWIIIRFVRLMQEYMLYYSKKPYEKTSVLAFGHIGISLIVAISTLVILQIVGVNFAGLLAFGGVSGIAIGFAAKDLLANFFGALMIYLDKPFRVGDWIRSPEKEIEGEVEMIGWRQTRILTFEKRPIYVPNSVFSTIVVENASRMTHRRLNETIGLRYEDILKVNDIVEDIKSMISEYPNVDNSQSLAVGVVKLTVSSVEIMIYCFTTTVTLVEFSKVRHEIMLGITNIVAKHNAELAINPTTVNVVAMPGKILE